MVLRWMCTLCAAHALYAHSADASPLDQATTQLDDLEVELEIITESEDQVQGINDVWHEVAPHFAAQPPAVGYDLGFDDVAAIVENDQGCSDDMDETWLDKSAVDTAFAEIKANTLAMKNTQSPKHGPEYAGCVASAKDDIAERLLAVAGQRDRGMLVFTISGGSYSSMIPEWSNGVARAGFTTQLVYCLDERAVRAACEVGAIAVTNASLAPTSLKVHVGAAKFGVASALLAAGVDTSFMELDVFVVRGGSWSPRHVIFHY
jgi:hypothetical protein